MIALRLSLTVKPFRISKMFQGTEADDSLDSSSSSGNDCVTTNGGPPDKHKKRVERWLDGRRAKRRNRRGVDQDEEEGRDLEQRDDDEYDDADDAFRHASADDSGALIRRATSLLEGKETPLVAYERRVALREIKAVLRSAFRDTGIAMPCGIGTWLDAPETQDTVMQFVALRGELERVLRREDEIDRLIGIHCRSIQGEWARCEYDPADEFEVQIRGGGRRLRRCEGTVLVLEAWLHAWVRRPDANDVVQRALEESTFLRGRLRDVLSAVHVPDSVQTDLVEMAESGPRLTVSVSRVTLGVPRYDALMRAADDWLTSLNVALDQARDRDNDPDIADAVASLPPSVLRGLRVSAAVQVAASVARRWLVEAREWERETAVPMFASAARYCDIESLKRRLKLLASVSSVSASVRPPFTDEARNFLVSMMTQQP